MAIQTPPEKLMIPPESSPDERATIRRIRWHVVLSWVAFAGIFKLASLVDHFDWTALADILRFGGIWLVAMWRRRTAGYPRFEFPSWFRWILWLFFGWAIVILITAFYLEPEQHRYVWIPLTVAVGISVVAVELYMFCTIEKRVRAARGTDGAPASL